MHFKSLVKHIFSQVIEAQEFQIFELREALERSREEAKRLNMLNVIHMDNAITRDLSQPTATDAGCSPIAFPQDTRNHGDQDSRNHGNQDACYHGDQVIPSRDMVEVGVNTSFVIEDGIEHHPHKVSRLSCRGFVIMSTVVKVQSRVRYVK